MEGSAVKELKALHETDRRRVAARVQALAEDPRPRGGEKLTGGCRYRVRRGSHRISYDVDDEAQIVTVVKIGHRRDVYR